MTSVMLKEEASAVSSKRIDRVVRLVGLTFALVPFLATGLLFMFAWATSRTFGAWPSYASPDPKSAHTVLYIASGLAIVASLPSVVVLAIGLPVVRRLRLDRLDVGLIATGMVGLVVLHAVFAGNLGDWYMD